MSARAYVLIEAEAGKIDTVVTTLQGLPGVTIVDPVTGPYDVVVVIELPEARQIGRLVMNELHRVEGIKRTVTCLAI